MKLKLKRLSGNTHPIPKRGTARAAAIDFQLCLTRPHSIFDRGRADRIGLLSNKPKKTQYDGNNLYLVPGACAMISLGFACEIENAVLKLFVRSSMGPHGIILANGTGIIDEDYRGELCALVRNIGDSPVQLSDGDRVVQGILEPLPRYDIVEVQELSTTERGSGGFGHTGS